MAEALTSDFLIIGGGIMGLTTAYALRGKYPDASITLIEKERKTAYHASGRNSGVLHAGFYYSADSLKARFCREGNSAWRSYVETYGLRINDCGKVVVTQSEEELPALEELYRRGQINGVPLRIVDEKELSDIEPNARTVSKALYSPTTAIVDPVAVCNHLRGLLAWQGVEIYLAMPYQKRLDRHTVQAGGRRFSAGHIINCAGLYADRIARDFGFCQDYAIIPFKGVYLQYAGSDTPIKRCIYRVPDLRNPFLGVHYSVTVNGTVKIGPTAAPALWRENYRLFSRFSPRELLEVLRWELPMLAFNTNGFRELALRELRKYSKPHMASLAAGMVKHIDATRFNAWMAPGIRAQLIDKRSMTLLHDFVVEGDSDSTHVLNAVSPAFTSSLPFSRWIVEQKTGGHASGT